MDKVELSHAYLFDCPNCGRENFCRGICKDATPDDKAELEEFGLSVEQANEVFWMIPPDAVKCQFCTTVFEVEM